MSPQGDWRLAPAYDLTFSSEPGGEHYLTVNGRGKDVTHADLERVAEKPRDFSQARPKLLMKSQRGQLVS